MDWESEHVQVYGEDSWTRVQRLAWVLTKRVIGYDPGDIDRIEEEGGRVDADENARRERLTRWRPATRLLALALWRAAADERILVDEVPLTAPLSWLGGARHADLYADPLPPWKAHMPGSWARLQRRDDLLESARWIATWHLLQDHEEHRPVRDTQDGTPELPLLLGDRCRAVEAGPYRDGAPPRWHNEEEHALEHVAWVADQRRAGVWQPGPDALQAAAELHPTLTGWPDDPELPAGVAGPTWIQRACRIAHIHTTLRTVLDHHREAAELNSHPRHPFGYALAATSVALGEFGPTAHELETLWTRRNTGVALWERAHIPVTTREHIRALERLVMGLAELCWDMNADPDEPH